MPLSEVPAGFLLVKTFSRLYRDRAGRYNLKRDKYGIPRIDKMPEQFPIQYRGVDREGLYGSSRSELRAEMRMAEFEDLEKCSVEGIVLELGDAETIYDLLGNQRKDYEIIWARTANAARTVPEGFHSIGYEPDLFFSIEHISASCDSMLFPRWHGTDEAGSLFLNWFDKLNRHGLFSSPDEAEAFLKYYLSLDWTEQGNFETVEVFVTVGNPPI